MAGLEVDIAGVVGSFAISARFVAEPGVTALFGRSGAGKSTILKMIAGTARPREGRIVADGHTLLDIEAGIDLRPRERRIGFVFQEDRLFPHLTVRRNLTYARWAGGRRAQRPLAEVVALLGLEEHLERLPGTLSGGERQRVAIGRALLAAPHILLMDEPLSSLDRPRRAEILPYLETVANETQVPILYVSHETDEVARLADRVVKVESGTAHTSGTPGEILGGGIGVGEEPSAILEGSVEAYDAAYETARVDIGGGIVELSVRDLPVGARVRLRMRADDVAIATSAHDGLSIRNQLWCTIETIDIAGASALVSLRFGSQRLFSRITAKSAGDLKLSRGQRVVALVKAVLVERSRLMQP